MKNETAQSMVSAHEKRLWITTAILGVILLTCLGLLVTATGPGFNTEDGTLRLRLVSAVNNYPWCPPEIPCPISALSPTQRWTVWLIRETRNARGVDKTYRTVFSVPLSW